MDRTCRADALSHGFGDVGTWGLGDSVVPYSPTPLVPQSPSPLLSQNTNLAPIIA